MAKIQVGRLFEVQYESDRGTYDAEQSSVGAIY
jgi:hypothetical protein